MPEKGWSAKGLLQPLWKRYPGGRDQLAADIGTTGSVLSSVNSGRRALGWKLARKLADALGVSLLELGAPELRPEDQQGSLLLSLLEEHEVRAERSRTAAAAALASIDIRLSRIEAELGIRDDEAQEDQ